MAPVQGQGRAIVFTTEGDSFSPVIVLRAPAQVLWTFADGETSEATAPVKNYGSSATRRNRLVVTPWSALRRINIGYDGGDGGSWDIEMVPDQHVSKVEGLRLVAPTLGQWCSSYNGIESLDFSGFVNLDTIECFLSGSLKRVSLANTPNLRRACFEDCDLDALDLSGSPALEDLRGALNAYPSIAFGETGAATWHICVRDNPQMTNRTVFADMSRFPRIAELFIWNDNQTGAIRIPSTHPDMAVSIQAAWNSYASLDLSGALTNPAAPGDVNFENNALTEVDITGCRQITTLNLRNNALDAAAVDAILAALDGLGRGSDDAPTGAQLMADLSGNAAPGGEGVAHAQNLAGRGWTVVIETGTLTPTVPQTGETSIAFVTSGDATRMRCDFLANGVSAVWQWSDGTATPAVSGEAAEKTGLGPGTHEHALVISNGGALTRFGGEGGQGGLVSMTGFANTPSLQILYAYQETLLTSLGRTDATRIREYHLLATGLSAEALDQVFADAAASNVMNGTIWSAGGTAASEADRAVLLDRGWSLE